MSEHTPEPIAPALDKLAAALAAFQAEMPTVAKAHTATVKSDKGSYSYTYAGLADVTEAAMPLLAKHGLSFVTLPGQGVLTGMLLHSSGQSLTASLPIGGGTPQQIGSSLTYMRRYLVGCITGLVTDDDDDGQQAERAARKSPKPTQPRPARREAATPGGITPQQLGKLGALMGEAGIVERDAALAYVGDVLGHPVSSRNDLSTREASRVIDALQADLQGERP